MVVFRLQNNTVLSSSLNLLVIGGLVYWALSTQSFLAFFVQFVTALVVERSSMMVSRAASSSLLWSCLTRRFSSHLECLAIFNMTRNISCALGADERSLSSVPPSSGQLLGVHFYQPSSVAAEEERGIGGVMGGSQYHSLTSISHSFSQSRFINSSSRFINSPSQMVCPSAMSLLGFSA